MNFQELVKLSILKRLRDNIVSNDLAVYAFTNENINDYLNKLKKDKIDKVLTVLASGDHLYNLALIKPPLVDLVDINPLTEYYALGFKKALFKMCDYGEYIEAIYYLFKSDNYDIDIEKKFWEKLFNLIEEKYQPFFRDIITFYFKMQKIYKRKIRLMQILTKDYYYNEEALRLYNGYMMSEENYEKLKEFLDIVKVSFNKQNIFLEDKKDYYDLIMASNVLDYVIKREFNMDSLYSLYRSLRNSLKGDGIIMAHYIYSFLDKKTLSYKSYPIPSTDILERELKREELIWTDKYKGDKDAVLVLRKY